VSKSWKTVGQNDDDDDDNDDNDDDWYNNNNTSIKFFIYLRAELNSQ
jgi:hypothetical protein